MILHENISMLLRIKVPKKLNSYPYPSPDTQYTGTFGDAVSVSVPSGRSVEYGLDKLSHAHLVKLTCHYKIQLSSVLM